MVRGRHIADLNIVRDDRPPKTLEYLQILAAEDYLQLDVFTGPECWSALQNAVRSQSDATPALKVLAGAGVDLAKITDDGRTALHFAAEWCLTPETLGYLCSTGQQLYVNRQDKWGWTPLHYAMLGNNSLSSSEPFSVAVSLVRLGADLTLKARYNDRHPYEQPPEAEFTACRLLKFSVPERYQTLLGVFERCGISVDTSVEGTVCKTVEPLLATI